MMFAFLAHAGAQPVEPPTAEITLRALVTTLGRLAAAPATLPAAQDAELKTAIRECRAALVALQRSLGEQSVSDDYLGDLTAAGLVVSRMLVKSAVEPDDLLRLAAVHRDIKAKQAWAEKHPAAPTSPVAFLLTVAGGVRSLDALELVVRSAFNHDCASSTLRLEGASPVRPAVRPGVHRVWLRSRVAPAQEGPRGELLADGTTESIELTPP